MGQEHGASELQDIGRTGCGEACVPAGRNDQMCVGPVGPEGVLCEMGDPSVLERLGRMEILRRLSVVEMCGVQCFDGLCRMGVRLTSSLRYASHPRSVEMWTERRRGVSCQSLSRYAILD